MLGFYVENGWEACCHRAIELLHLGGVGHSLVLHSRDERVIHEFFAEKPAFRISVNTNSALGAVGYTTGFAPAMTLGPGAWGGSSTSDNITPLHLINIKRLGEEIRPYHDPLRGAAPARAAAETPGRGWNDAAERAAAEAAPLAAAEVQGIVDRFLAEIRTVPR